MHSQMPRHFCFDTNKKILPCCCSVFFICCCCRCCYRNTCIEHDNILYMPHTHTNSMHNINIIFSLFCAETKVFSLPDTRIMVTKSKNKKIYKVSFKCIQRETNFLLLCLYLIWINFETECFYSPAIFPKSREESCIIQTDLWICVMCIYVCIGSNLNLHKISQEHNNNIWVRLNSSNALKWFSLNFVIILLFFIFYNSFGIDKNSFP